MAGLVISSSRTIATYCVHRFSATGTLSDAVSRGKKDVVWRVRCEHIAIGMSEQPPISADLLVAGEGRPRPNRRFSAEGRALANWPAIRDIDGMLPNKKAPENRGL
ncbi:hypothetical protein ACVIWV_001759 [Bradyrhizobium diazoefficiens]|uniref:hypothetical protein n=1 Tax=Bradyrhizobium TaxID=374 RepID=UPI0012FF3E4D|nr:hypothetical protein [Bradyrhizobium diazoefficiens]MBR0866634.1 hypothetical protein [Bradyrhizobium diazoefficiens]MBR0891135.1 hypothetical protein [Bradyrhizobium diazoefficiens]MBR0922799.1 hypothetical protein [Bradyrhizobium diazoefficiens]QLD42545.1 hypothetical protein HUW42_16760 [Bradyrhizobium diazoefficiens]WLB35883.1 hypothetical protein QIH78_31035 [Bradyrhizobium diazoefficiens]